MNNVRKWGIGAALGVAAWSVLATGARADHRREVIVLPPPPLGQRSLGLIEEDFMRMRATSPNPDQFHGGRWNPRVQVITPPHFTPGVPVFGVVPVWPYPYPAYPSYPGYVYPGAGYGGPFGVPPVVQREVVIIREPAPPAGAPDSGAGRAPGAPAQEAAPAPAPQAGESFSDALDDIRRAWLNGDSARLRARFRADRPVRVFTGGEYRYSVPGPTFAAMLEDAMKRLDTLAFEFDRPESGEAGRVRVTGRHTYLDAAQQRHTATISYTLERIEGRWYIVEAGSSMAAPAAPSGGKPAPPASGAPGARG